MPIRDFDNLRHGDKMDAEGQRALAFVEAALGACATARVGRHHPEEGRALMRDVADGYKDRLYSGGDNLERKINAADAVLQTTIIDPHTYWAGAIVADQPPFGEDEVRRISVDVVGEVRASR